MRGRNISVYLHRLRHLPCSTTTHRLNPIESPSGLEDRSSFVSMAPAVSPISYASSIIGFISFAFTFFTLLNVFWASLRTICGAGKQVHRAFDNLRSEVHGEREYFKKALKQSRSRSRGDTQMQSDNAPLRILNDSVKHLVRDLKRLEEPFLKRSPFDRDRDLDIELSGREPLRGDYAPMTLRRRYIWLRSKDEMITLADRVNRIQSRRIAYDSNNIVS